MIMATVKASPAVLLTSALTLFLFACTQPSASPLDSPVPSQVATESNTTPSKSHEQEVDALLASPSANIPGVLIFVSDLFGKPGIGALDLRDRTIRMLTSGSIDADPSLSSDGRKIVFISTRNRDPYYDIYIMNIDGSDQNPIRSANDLSIRSNFSPVLSPDGQYVVFHSDRDLSGNMDIYVAEISGGKSKRLTNHPAMDINPSWSPDGRYIVFSSDRDGQYDIYIMDSDGSNLKKLFNNPEYSDLYPIYSPNGQYIAFTVQFYLGGGDSHIALIRSDGSGYRMVTQGRGQYQRATWAGNRALVFSGRRSVYDKWQIFITRIDNFNPIKLTQGEANFYTPSLLVLK
jgi:TolB protein